MGLENLEKIIREQQRGKENQPEFMIGEQLLDMARRSKLSAELLEQDLAVEEMNLTAAAAQLKKYADESHKQAKCFCITPVVAERILREFYHLPAADEEEKPSNGGSAAIVNLADFL